MTESKTKKLKKEAQSLNLNKDYLNEREASVYVGGSVSGFRKVVKMYDIPSSKVHGLKIVYRRQDLNKLIEKFFTAPEIRLE